MQKLTIIRYVLVIALLSLQASGALAFTASVKVPMELANMLASKQFPQDLALAQHTIQSSHPKIFITDANRVAISTSLLAKNRTAIDTGSRYQREGAVMISTLLRYDAGNKRLALIEPRIESLLFYKDDKFTQNIRKELYTAWSELTGDNFYIAVEDYPELKSMTTGLQRVETRDNALYLHYAPNFGELFSTKE